MKPNRLESARREREFRRLVSEGSSLRTACQEARIDPYRALDVVATPAFWAEVGTVTRTLQQPAA